MKYLSIALLILIGCGGGGGDDPAVTAQEAQAIQANAPDGTNCYVDVSTGDELGPITQPTSIARAKESGGVIIVNCGAGSVDASTHNEQIAAPDDSDSSSSVDDTDVVPTPKPTAAPTPTPEVI